jgi:hypothetical protein
MLDKRPGMHVWWVFGVLMVTKQSLINHRSCLAVQRGPRVSLWTTLFAIILSYFSTFWSYGYTRLARKVKRYANVTEGADLQSKEVKKQAVRRTLHTGMTINVIGMGTALLGLQAMVGMLVRHESFSHCSLKQYPGLIACNENAVGT